MHTQLSSGALRPKFLAGSSSVFKLCVRMKAEKALERLHICSGPPELSLLSFAISSLSLLDCSFGFICRNLGLVNTHH